MRCNVCHASAVHERTVFHGTMPTTIKLCDPCADRVQLAEHMQKIVHAADHTAKTVAVDELIAAVHKAKA